MKKGNKILALTLSAALAAGCLAGCGSKGGSDSKSGSFDTSQEISVVSREEGSGTRGAFVELTGVEERTQMEIKLIRQLRARLQQTVQK